MTVLNGTSRVDQILRLADGRRLGFAEYGPTEGLPLFLFHGLPGSRLAVQEMWTDDPELRVVAPDRPGFGLSTFQPGRRLLDWADDVRQLADALGTERFLVAGFSGGGPHALAVAHHLPSRVVAVASIGGIGRFDTRESRADMNAANRLVVVLARRAPVGLWAMMGLHARAVRRHPAKVLAEAAKDKHLPAADREALSSPRIRGLGIDTAAEAFRQGLRGVVYETRLCVRLWGFDPAKIKPPVDIWHGDQDTNVPVVMAQRLAARIPGSRLTVFPGEGHLIVPRHWEEILARLVSVDTSST